MSTADWNQLYNKFYRKFDVYEMLWNHIELDQYIVAGAKHGGPIALVRNQRKVLLLGMANDADGRKPKMRIFTAAGQLICSFEWNHKGLVAMEWSDREELICVLEDGSVLIYSLHGTLVRQFPLGPECLRDGVAECYLWGSGLAVRTGHKSDIVVVNNFQHPRPQTFPNPATAGLSSPPTCMAVIPPEFNASGKPEVLLGTAEGSIIVIDDKAATDQSIDKGPFVKMVVSPSGRTIACFNEEGTLYVMSTDFTQSLSKFGTRSKRPPKDLVWCGDKSVILYWDSIGILMVGPYGDFVNYSFESSLALVTECDGVRIITNKHSQFLQRVPDSTESIFKSGSALPPALLYDAAEAFAEKSVKADDNIREIKEQGKLGESVDACLAAAAHEFNHKNQRGLLQAAAYGKLFAPDYAADHFVDMCRTLRVLNAVRHYKVGLPLTYDQYTQLGAEVLVDRLVNRHNHLLALRICKYLHISVEKVLIHWACTKIRGATDTSDMELGQLIVTKLQNSPGISFRKIAATAFKSGRRGLAIMLLEYEPLASDQVPLLVSMKEEELALNKAELSGDTDLVYLVVLHLKKHRPDDFFRIIRDRPLARNLFIAYCKQCDLNALKEFYYAMQQPTEIGHISALQAYRCERFSDRLKQLDVAINFYQKDKANPFNAAVTAEHVRLLTKEKELEKGQKSSSAGAGLARDSYLDKSVSQLIEAFILQGDLHAALKIQDKFKVPEKRFWHIEVSTLAKCRSWQELAKRANNKKVPPIGFGPFVEACVEQKAFVEAARYIVRLPEPHQQMEWLCHIGYWKEAVDVAAGEKDEQALQVIRVRCRTPAVIQQIDRLLQQGFK